MRKFIKRLPAMRQLVEMRAKLRQEAIDKGVSNLNKYESDRFKPPYENADVPDGAYMDGAIANRAIELIDQMDSSQPFFLAVGFLRPHLPFNAPTKYWNMYKEDEIQLAEFRTKSKNPVDIAYKGGWEINSYKMPGIEYNENKQGLLILPDDIQRKLIHGYYAATSYIDAQVGKVLAKLKEKGLNAIKCHRVIDGGKDSIGNDVVVAGEGTGLVHIAPGCGAIDNKIGKKIGIVEIAPLNDEGHYLEGFNEFTGLLATDPKTKDIIICLLYTSDAADE